MPRLTTLKPTLGKLESRVQTHTTKEDRMTGTPLQRRRLKMWKANPHCAMCGKITQYPYGFQLDHITPLYKGGQDVEENCQILCVDECGTPGCHTLKTREDMKQ